MPDTDGLENMTGQGPKHLIQRQTVDRREQHPINKIHIYAVNHDTDYSDTKSIKYDTSVF